MNVHVETTINASKEVVWDIITNIEHSKNVIKAINSIEVLEQPSGNNSIEGLKWKESRTMFGKEATEVMWITKAEENNFYETRAESHGAIYTTQLSIKPAEQGVILGMDFGAEIVTLGAKVMWFLTGWMMKSSMSKALNQDLADIKAVAEAK